MCYEFEGWFGKRRSAQPARREQASSPVEQRPAEPVAPAPVTNVVQPASRVTQREKQPA